jgi:hypothetical protein
MYINGLTPLFDTWVREADILNDKRMTWEYMKYKIRDYSVKYGKNKKKEIGEKEKNLEKRLKEIDEEIDKHDSETNLAAEKLIIVNELKIIDKYKTEGLILRTKSTWYEEGEKSSKYFLRLLTRNVTKTNMTKLCMDNGTVITNQNDILKKQAEFYEKLYTDNLNKEEYDMKMYLDKINSTSLSEQDRMKCNGMVTKEEC